MVAALAASDAAPPEEDDSEEDELPQQKEPEPEPVRAQAFACPRICVVAVFSFQCRRVHTCAGARAAVEYQEAAPQARRQAAATALAAVAVAAVATATAAANTTRRLCSSPGSKEVTCDEQCRCQSMSTI